MTPTLTIQEIAIAIAARNHAPTLLTSEFLKYSGIVPPDWELARPPILNPQLSQVAFTNGINIVAQPGAITFIESLGTKSLETVEIPSIARKYIEILPHADYQGISINPRSFLTFEEANENTARQYIASMFLSKEASAQFGQAPVKAAVNLVYSLNAREFNLSVAEAMLQLPDSEPKPAVLFSGSFQYEVKGEKEGEKLQHLYQLLENWLPDLETYREIVTARFVGL